MQTTKSITDWGRQHNAIMDLVTYLNKVAPTIKLGSVNGNVFMGAAALYKCNRLLHSIDDAISQGFGDTAGANVRLLYDTWIYGHLLMLGDAEEARKAWGMTRKKAEKLVRAMDLSEKVKYPEDMPEPIDDIGIQQRAQSLGKKLLVEDSESASMPEYCYNNLYRAESHLSAHANVDSIAQYARFGDGGDPIIDLHGQNEKVEWRSLMSAYITSYFAKQVFRKAGIDTVELEEIDRRLGS